MILIVVKCILLDCDGHRASFVPEVLLFKIISSARYGVDGYGVHLPSIQN
jgi:hypothetical protein